MSRSVRLTGYDVIDGPDSGSADDVVLRVNDLEKSFGGAIALRGVSFELRRGEAHALVGANGAGKSTVIRTLAGLVQADHGTIEVDGVAVAFRTPTDPMAHGLAFIHQELNLVPHFTAFENIVLGLPPRKIAGFASWRHYRRPATDLIHELGMHLDLDREVGTLTTSAQWLVAMCRALIRNAHIIAMDEPTAALSANEVDALLAICRRLTARGVSLLYVSHRLEEIESLCDAATVFRDGTVVDRIRRPEITKARLIRGIAGRDITSIGIPARTTPLSTETCLTVRSLTRLPDVDDVSFSLQRGEILGIAGLVGSGRTELARLIVGADRATGGVVDLNGTRVRLSSPVATRRAGIGLVPEERRSQALILDESIELNMTLGWPASTTRLGHTPLQSPSRTRLLCAKWASSVSLKASNLRQPVRTLSGGNQQKVAIARVLGQRGDVVILDEPSRGVDIGARSQIHELVRGAADSGRGVIVISSDLEELVGCDRVLVMSRGRIVGEFNGADVAPDALLAAAFEADTASSEEGTVR